MVVGMGRILEWSHWRGCGCYRRGRNCPNLQIWSRGYPREKMAADASMSESADDNSRNRRRCSGSIMNAMVGNAKR